MRRTSVVPTRESAVSLISPARTSVLQRKCACGEHTTAGNECDDCQKRNMTLQRSASSAIDAVAIPPVVHDVLRSPGQPLDARSRTQMESSFGHDFSNVRIHTDSQAEQSAAQVNARAYAVERDVVFGAGQYQPQSDKGQHLLAHELAHVVQQSSGSVGPDAEARAEHSANRVMRGEPVSRAMAGRPSAALQRAGKDDVPAGTGAPSPTAAQATAGSAESPINEFDFDKSKIPPQHLERLAALRTKLIAAPGATVVLTGHTDTVGNEKYNVDLGKRRAEAVRDFLTQNKGVNPSQIKIESMGELAPAAGQSPAKLDPEKGERNAKNRRVEIQVTGLPTPASPGKDWSLDPANPGGKKKPFNWQLPPDYPLPPGKSTDKPATTQSTDDKQDNKDKKDKDKGPEVEGAIVATPDGIETTVEVTWKAKSGLGKALHSQFSFTVHVGPDGFSQLESDLTLLKKKITDSTLGGVIQDLQFSMGFNPALNLDKNKANQMVTTFSEKFKVSLEADLVIPKTGIKIPIEISPSVDIHGKPGVEFKVTIFKF